MFFGESFPARLIRLLRSRVVYRVFLPFSLIIILGVSIALPYGITTTQRIMQERADAQVSATASIVRNLIQRELEKLLTFCELKMYSTSIQESINRRDIVTLRQLIIPMRARTKVDFVIIFDRDGREILRFDDRHLMGEDLKSQPIVRNGLNGMRYFDLLESGNRLILAAIAPNETGGVPGGMNGGMLVGQVMSDALVAEIAVTAGTGLALSVPEGRIMASAMPRGATSSPQLNLRRASENLLAGSREVLETVELGRTPYRAAHQFFKIHGRPRAIVSVIMDVSAISNTTRRVSMVMITLMLVGVAVAVLFSLLIARSISQPIERLAAATERASGGELVPMAEEQLPDEIGRLSVSFNDMIDRLRGYIDDLHDARDRAESSTRKLEESNLELKKAKSELLQAGKLVAMGQLGAGIAHELNQPLLAIGLFAEQTQRHLEPGSTSWHNLERIVSQTERMSQIVNEIRMFARQSLLEPRETDLALPIRRAAALVEKQFSDANIAVELCLDPRVPPILGDDNQLQQVIINLLTNARDAILPKDHGTIVVTLSVRADGELAMIEVRDDGVGICPDILNEIFLPFFTTKRDTKGLGLGLSITHGIIERHGGFIDVESVQGQGTAFRVVLPTVRARQCWEAVDCAVCRPGADRESCPVYTRDQGFGCWLFFQRAGDEAQVSGRCHGCDFYRSRQISRKG